MPCRRFQDDLGGIRSRGQVGAFPLGCVEWMEVSQVEESQQLTGSAIFVTLQLCTQATACPCCQSPRPDQLAHLRTLTLTGPELP